MNCFEVLRRIARMNGDHVGADGDEGDRAEVVLLEAAVLRRRHVGGKARGGREQRVAVRRRADHGLGRDVAAGAAAVLDDEALLETAFELGRNQPRDHVGEAAGREGDDDGDVLRRDRFARARAARDLRGCDGADDQRPEYSIMTFSFDFAGTLVRANRERQCDALSGRRRPPAPTAPARSASRRSPASPAGRSRARCRSPAASRPSAARKSSSIGYCSP